MSLLHINNLAQGEGGLEKVFPSSAPMHIRKTNNRHDELVDLQEVAANSASPPRALNAVTQLAELVIEEKQERNRRKRVHNRKKNIKGEADQAETVSAGVVEGGNVEEERSAVPKDVKEKRVRTRQPKKQQGDVIDVVPQGDEAVAPEQMTTEPVKQPRQNKNQKAQTNDSAVAREPEMEPTSEQQLDESNGENVEAPTQTKGNKRRQRQRQNKKNAKLLAQNLLQDQQQGDTVEIDGVQADVATKVSEAVTPPVEAVKPQQQPAKLKKQPAQPRQKKQQTKQPSPKVEEHGCGQYKHSALKHLFVKQSSKDSSSTDSTPHHHPHNEDTIRPIRQPKGPTAIGERGFSAEYRRSRTIKV